MRNSGQGHISIGEEYHRNPSRDKLRRHGSRSSKEAVTRNPSADFKSDNKSIGATITITNIRDKGFLHKCFE